VNSDKVCHICQQHFVPHPSLKARQKTCGAAPCRKELKRRIDKAWRERNPDYFKGRYDTVLKAWHAEHPYYKKQYRQEHPEYRRKNALYLKEYRQKQSRVRHTSTDEGVEVS
jgi:hypothetical protein